LDGKPYHHYWRSLPWNSGRFPGNYSDVPWADIVAMRNLLIHHYFGIDKEAVWIVVERDIPELKRNMEIILNNLK